jgi:hypothetical protein
MGAQIKYTIHPTHMTKFHTNPNRKYRASPAMMMVKTTVPMHQTLH